MFASRARSGLMRVLFILIMMFAPGWAWAQSCPAPLRDVRKLVLVTADTFTSPTATLQRFVRTAPNAPWQADSGPATALIGHNGLGWAHAFRAYARQGEPIKTDGDKRAPAGFFKIGRSFGFGPSRRPDYLRITEGTTCVDDPRSPAYNAITSRAKVGWQVHGENMWRVKEYRRGLLVDYPTSRKARAGSCIFIHVWRRGATGTAGCVALPEPQVAALQDFSESGAVLAVLPRQALTRFKGCLPN
jgi:L,D-peptidoglycan transpeptidase YkuD (ErfK/YbiS/YcfS/YnhG family)